MKPIEEFKNGLKTCEPCRGKDRSRLKPNTETHNCCSCCKKMKPIEEFKSDRTCMTCFKKRKNPKRRLNTYKKDAKRRGYEWALTDDHALKLFLLPCHYCNAFEGLNGIDRQNNSLGYVDGNCVPCCETCNFGKLKLAESNFLEMCLKVTAHRFPWVVPFYSMWMACSSETKHS